MMNCEEFRTKVSAVIDGEVSAEEKEAFLEHRADCAACFRFASEIEKVDGILRAHPLPELPPDLVERLGEIEREWTVPPVPWGPYVRVYIISAVAAGAVIVGSMVSAEYWRALAATLIPAVAWAAV